MDASSRAFPVSQPYTLGGREFTVDPKIIDRQAEIEAEILRLKPDPLEVVEQAEERFKSKPGLLETVLPGLLTMAVSLDARVATPHDYTTFCASFRGHAFCFWLAVRDGSPDVTVEDIQKLVMKDVAAMAEKAAADGGLEMVQVANDTVVEVLAQMEAVINKATGEDPLGNLTGSPTTPQTTSKESTEPTASDNQSTGDSSSE